MRHRTLGDLSVGAIGLGTMPLSIDTVHRGRPDEARALATVHAALDASVTLLDTADSYHPPGAEEGERRLGLSGGSRHRAADRLYACDGSTPADSSTSSSDALCRSASNALWPPRSPNSRLARAM
jgi:diketogulonate reductase-like aldo/keto reductase